MATRGKILTSSCGERRNARSIGPVVDSENGYMHGTRNLLSVVSQKFTEKIEPTWEANARCTLTHASRRLQKHAAAAPLPLSRN